MFIEFCVKKFKACNRGFNSGAKGLSLYLRQFQAAIAQHLRAASERLFVTQRNSDCSIFSEIPYGIRISVNIKGFLISKEDEEATSLGTSLRPI
jgi:hypothetical protein